MLNMYAPAIFKNGSNFQTPIFLSPDIKVWNREGLLFENASEN